MRRLNFNETTTEDLELILSNLRPTDKVEFSTLSPWHDPAKFLKAHTQLLTFGFKKPLGVFGYVVYGNSLYVTCLATSELEKEKIWKTFTKHAMAYIHNVVREHMGISANIIVWNKNTASLNWLRIIGFVPTGTFFEADGKRFDIHKYVR